MNVLVFTTDQHKATTIGAYGHSLGDLEDHPAVTKPLSMIAERPSNMPR